MPLLGDRSSFICQTQGFKLPPSFVKGMHISFLFTYLQCVCVIHGFNDLFVSNCRWLLLMLFIILLEFFRSDEFVPG